MNSKRHTFKYFPYELVIYVEATGLYVGRLLLVGLPWTVGWLPPIGWLVAVFPCFLMLAFAS